MHDTGFSIWPVVFAGVYRSQIMDTGRYIINIFLLPIQASVVTSQCIGLVFWSVSFSNGKKERPYVVVQFSWLHVPHQSRLIARGLGQPSATDKQFSCNLFTVHNILDCGQGQYFFFENWLGADKFQNFFTKSLYCLSHYTFIFCFELVSVSLKTNFEDCV